MNRELAEQLKKAKEKEFTCDEKVILGEKVFESKEIALLGIGIALLQQSILQLYDEIDIGEDVQREKLIDLLNLTQNITGKINKLLYRD